MATVVTGAGGHVGACLVRRLLDEGRTLKLIELERGPGLEGLDVDLRIGDIRDPDFLRSVFAPGDVVYHLASVISTTGDKGGLVSSVNVNGARTVAEVALERGCSRLVHFSSIHAYDIDTLGAPVTEETAPATINSDSAYNRSKAEGQAAVLEVGERGLDVVVVNPCGVIGPYDYKASRMGKVFRAVARGGREKPGPGGFNWVDVRDVVDGAIRAEAQGTPGEAYILSGHWRTNLDMVRLAAQAQGVPPMDKTVPWWVVNTMVALAPVFSWLGKRPPVNKEMADALRANPDMPHDKASRGLGYAPRPIETTVADIMQWYADEDIIAKDKQRYLARKQAAAAR